MTRKIVSSKNVLSVPRPFSQAVRSGQFMYLSGQVGMNPKTGLPIMGIQDLPPTQRKFFSGKLSLFERTHLAPAAAQTYWIMENMHTLLKEQRASLDDLVKVNVYLQDMENYEGVESVFRRIFPRTPPACTVLEVPKIGAHKDLRVTIDGIAVIPSKNSGTIKKEVIRLGDVPEPAGHFSQAVKCGNLIFISGLIALDADTGGLVRSYRDLGPEGVVLARKYPTVNRRQEKVRAQMFKVFQHIGAILESQGSALDQILYGFLYTRDMRTDFNSCLPIWEHCIPKGPPACSGFGMPDIRRDQEVMVEMDAIALLPSPHMRRKANVKFDPKLTNPTCHYTMACASDKYLFLSGRGGINWQRGGELVMRFSELTDWNGQGQLAGRFHEEDPVLSQTWYIYETIKNVLATQGATMDDVIKTNVWLKDMRNFPKVEAIAKDFFPNGGPAMTMIPVKNIGPWEGDGLTELHVEIDCTAAMPKGPRSSSKAKIFY